MPLARISSGNVIVQVTNRLVLRRDDPVHQVADGKHSDDAVALQNREMSDPPRSDNAHALVNAMVRCDEERGSGHDFADKRFAGLPALENDLAGVVSLGNDPGKIFGAQDNQCADVLCRHALDSLVHKTFNAGG
jgi:hypothetical protein